jgi:hypothetical protein
LAQQNAGPQTPPVSYPTVKAWCMKCKGQRLLKSWEPVILRNGAEATKGICSECGSTIYRIGPTPAPLAMAADQGLRLCVICGVPYSEGSATWLDCMNHLEDHYQELRRLFDALPTQKAVNDALTKYFAGDGETVQPIPLPLTRPLPGPEPPMANPEPPAPEPASRSVPASEPVSQSAPLRAQGDRIAEEKAKAKAKREAEPIARPVEEAPIVEEPVKAKTPAKRYGPPKKTGVMTYVAVGVGTVLIGGGTFIGLYLWGLLHPAEATSHIFLLAMVGATACLASIPGLALYFFRQHSRPVLPSEPQSETGEAGSIGGDEGLVKW